MNSLINTGDLDFFEIKQNLKTFLSAQSELVDYDFEGSIISTLIDVLAYNTHYNALYTNLAINEMFIDSASKRDSLASISKLLGYTPRSITSARAVVNITVNSYDSNTNSLTLAAGATFSTEINNTAYSFVLVDNVTSTKLPEETEFEFTNVTLYEGESLSITYTQAANTRFVIPENDADINSVKISVFNPGSNTTKIYTKANSMVGTTGLDDVFFVKYIEGQLYEVFFGDGVIGSEVQAGSIVSMSYLVTSGEAANNCAIFSYSGGLDSNKYYDVLSVYASAFGAAEEDKESIRFFAPLSYQAQNRAVTAQDYAAILSELYPQIETISVWGGQDNIPPIYGKVFISAKPYGRDAFADLEKRDIQNSIIAKKSIVTIQTEIIDPTYYDIEVTANVYYNPSKTASNIGQLQTLVKNAVAAHGNTLSKFDSTYRHSKVTAIIDSADPSIISSINTIRVRRKLQLISNVDSNYSVNFYNPIAASNTSTFYSTRFYLYGYDDRGYLKNNGTSIDFYTEDSAGTPFFVKTVGSLDYNGIITLQNLNIVSMYDDYLEFVFYPSSYDVLPPNGSIIRILNEKIKVNVLVDKLSQTKNSKQDHIFSLSR